MMTWDSFLYFALASCLCWLLGSAFALRSRRLPAIGFTLVGCLVFLAFIVGFWCEIERPPLRTMGETRLWYSFFLSVVGLFLYVRHRHSWMLCFSTLMSLVFSFVNVFKPEIHSTTLMPALQSWWFVPHVIVYMFSYAILGAGTLFSLYLWFRKQPLEPSDSELRLCDGLVRAGWAFLTMGMVMGALWAKEAWGDYWTWDPKETWALATWLSYLLYLHLRPSCRNHDLLFALLLFSFALLQMCWWGIKFLPAVQSIHVY